MQHHLPVAGGPASRFAARHSANRPKASARRCSAEVCSAAGCSAGRSGASRNNRSAAASSARCTTAPTSGVNRPRMTSMPSSSTHVWRCRCWCRRSAPRRDDPVHAPPPADQLSRARRCRTGPRPGAGPRWPASRCGSARAPSNTTAPALHRGGQRGNSASARATRTSPRAAPRSMPVRQFSQCAQDRQPSFQPRTRRTGG
jgi:hypothetical protein